MATTALKLPEKLKARIACAERVREFVREALAAAIREAVDTPSRHQRELDYP
ncbi:MAG: hypothetical protein ABI423_14510 [Burkholderiales bacterium]